MLQTAAQKALAGSIANTDGKRLGANHEHRQRPVARRIYCVGDEKVKFLQIWIEPKLQNIAPR